jgi:hypothetical protein
MKHFTAKAAHSRPSREEAQNKAMHASSPSARPAYLPSTALHVQHLQRTIGNYAVQRMVSAQTGASGLIQRTIPDSVKKDEDVYYKDGMKEAEGRAVIQKITKQDKAALDGMQGGDEMMLQHYKESPHSMFAHEWGLGLDRDDPGGDTVLIAGGKNGVMWGPYLKHLIPLAHAHPFREDRKIDKNIVFFDEINGANDTQKGSQRLLILPSASDVEFSAYQGVADHTVYTPYAVLDHKTTGRKAIANPSIPQFAGAPRLSFRILNAAVDKDNDKHIFCTLAAMEGDTEFWRKDGVLADMTKGGHSTLFF